MGVGRVARVFHGLGQGHAVEAGFEAFDLHGVFHYLNVDDTDLTHGQAVQYERGARGCQLTPVCLAPRHPVDLPD